MVACQTFLKASQLTCSVCKKKGLVNEDFVCLLETKLPDLKEDIDRWEARYGEESIFDYLSNRKQIDNKPAVCPLSYVYKNIPQAFTLWNIYQKAKQFNTLPYSGGIMDQPNIIMEAFTIIDTQISKYESERNKNGGN